MHRTSARGDRKARHKCLARFSLIVSDEAPHKETAAGTDFIVVLSDEPQGALQRRSPGSRPVAEAPTMQQRIQQPTDHRRKITSFAIRSGFSRSPSFIFFGALQPLAELTRRASFDGGTSVRQTCWSAARKEKKGLNDVQNSRWFKRRCRALLFATPAGRQCASGPGHCSQRFRGHQHNQSSSAWLAPSALAAPPHHITGSPCFTANRQPRRRTSGLSRPKLRFSHCENTQSSMK